MALDYSQLSDEELEAIANNDYSRLSDATLQAIASEGDRPVNPAPYATSQLAMPAAQSAAEAARGVANLGYNTVKNTVDIGRNLMNVNAAGWKEMATHPIQTAKAFGLHHPILSNAMEGAGQLAKSVGTGVGRVAAPFANPETLFTAPYTMAAYEQEKIRQNPAAPGLEYNPYAQVQRNEFGTQGQAAAANRRTAIRSQQYGGLTAEEQQMLRADQQISLAMRVKAARKVLGQE